ncbi:hypothetical protein [Armatimonas sp.]|uniref:hypothetical protein n=1 Tax=Armatimonas sp. TaxID=1872638 RepID=UPI0037537405
MEVAEEFHASVEQDAATLTQTMTECQMATAHDVATLSRAVEKAQVSTAHDLTQVRQTVAEAGRESVARLDTEVTRLARTITESRESYLHLFEPFAEQLGELNRSYLTNLEADRGRFLVMITTGLSDMAAQSQEATRRAEELERSLESQSQVLQEIRAALEQQKQDMDLQKQSMNKRLKVLPWILSLVSLLAVAVGDGIMATFLRR